MATKQRATPAPETPPEQRQTLHEHAPRPHVVRNANHRHQAERLSLNDQIAVWVSLHVGTMVCAYVFAGIGIGSLVGVITSNALIAAVFGSLSSYFLQLVLLPVIMVGQNVQSRHAELQTEEMFHGILNTEHDADQTIEHLSKQDAEILRIARMLEQLLMKQPAPATTAITIDIPQPATRKTAAKKVSVPNG